MSKDKEMPEKADLKSLDISVENRAKLKQLFPSVFTETKYEKGEPVESVDFEKLKAELGTFSDVFEARRERYGMDWPGKKDCMKLIQKTSIATLKPCREESVNFDETENLFIEGDNLEVLKLLQKSYYGKVKMIYLDPPYNTGGEFIYPDDYSESLDTYLSYAGLTDDEGKKFSTNTPNEGRYHTKWMNMMYPRLYLARNLLTDDGVIFVSIDDNEVHELRMMMNDVFGEDNFVDTICWKKKYGGGAKEKYLVSVHEYILVYAKFKADLPEILVEFDEQKARRFYKYKDENFARLGYYRTHPLEAVKSFDIRENLRFPVTAPDGTKVYPKRQWRWSRERFEKALAKDEVIFSKNKEDEWVLSSKQYLNEEDGTQRKTKAQSLIDDVFTQEGTKEIVDIFGDAKIFSFPKPTRLTKKLIEIGGLSSDDIILDFFAGSGTTAQAILEKNMESNGDCRFILVQLPEPCEEDSEAAKAGYTTIADIGKERIRRAIKKLGTDQAVKSKKAEGDLLKSQEEQKKPDLGFKVLKLDKSNFDVWDGSEPEPTDEKLAKQLEAFVEHIDRKATQEDILFELLLKAGFKPTEKIEKKKFVGKTVFSIAEGLLLICLEDEITKELIEAIAEAEPLQFICLDRGFKGNDQLKANAVQTFAARNQGRDKQDQIVFRTV